MDRCAFLPIPEIDFNRIDPESFLSERNELAMYQCFSRKLSSHEVAPTDGIAAVQHYVSWSGDEQSKIGHRSNDAHDPVQTTRASAHCYAAISCDGHCARSAEAGTGCSGGSSLSFSAVRLSPGRQPRARSSR